MAFDTSYTVSGAGVVGVNGVYTQNGTYNGVPTYTNGTYFMFAQIPGEELWWCIDTSVNGNGEPLYNGPTLWDGIETPDSDAWGQFTGDLPVPTVTAGGEEPSIQGFRVTGAGSPEWDGDYFPDGVSEYGVTRYKLDSNHWLVYGYSDYEEVHGWFLVEGAVKDDGGDNNGFGPDPVGYKFPTADTDDASGQYQTAQPYGISADSPAPTVTAITGGSSDLKIVMRNGQKYAVAEEE